jgi:outer membrane protein TolC
MNGQKASLAILLALFFACPDKGNAADRAYTWGECVDIARKNHPLLMSARERSKQAQAEIGISRSPMLPEISANAGVNRSKQDTGVTGPGDGATDSFSYGITASQLIFDGLKSYNDMQAARKSAEAAAFDYSITSSVVRLDLRLAYVQLYGAQEYEKLAAEIARMRKDNLELVRMRYEAGREHRGSLLTAGANMSQAKLDIAKARRDTELYRCELARQMGLRVHGPGSVETVVFPAGRYVNEPDIAGLAASHPSLLKAASSRAASEYALKSARDSYAPTVSLDMSARKYDTKWPPDRNNWSVGVGATLPLMQGGRRISEVDRAEALYRERGASERDARDTVEMDLRRKWTSLKNSIEAIQVQAEFMKAAEERSKIAGAQYSIGMLQFDNWIIIENDLVRVKKSYLDAVVEALTAEADWLQARGVTIENEE